MQTANYFAPLVFNAASNTHYTGQTGDDQSPGMAVNFSSSDASSRMASITMAAWLLDSCK